MKLVTKTKSVLAAAVLAGVALAGPQVAHSAIINAVLQQGINTVQDTSAERILRAGSSVTTGVFVVGDVIESVLRFDTVNSTQINVAVGSLTYQMTAYSQLAIAAIFDLTTNSFCAVSCPLGDTVRLFFAPTGALGAGVMAEVYERLAGDPALAFGNTAATSIANVLAQDLILEIGLKEADDFWFSDAINNIGIIATATPGSGQAPNGALALSVLTNPGGLPIGINAISTTASPTGGGPTLHDVVGDASIFARETGTNTEWLVSDNINVSFNVVPEPSSMALLGLALLGMGGALRRKA
jgi:hypothetical protein